MTTVQFNQAEDVELALGKKLLAMSVINASVSFLVLMIATALGYTNAGFFALLVLLVGAVEAVGLEFWVNKV